MTPTPQLIALSEDVIVNPAHVSAATRFATHREISTFVRPQYMGLDVYHVNEASHLNVGTI